MLHPAQKIASFFVAKKLIPAQDYEWAVYGLQRRLLAAVFYPILFLIGLLVSDVYSTVLFFVVFTSLRHRVGGHHAGSAIRCLINSSLIVLCGLFLYPQIMCELLVLAVAFSVLPLLPWGVWLSKTAAAAVTLAASMLIAGKIQNGGFTHEQE